MEKQEKREEHMPDRSELLKAGTRPRGAALADVLHVSDGDKVDWPLNVIVHAGEEPE